MPRVFLSASLLLTLALLASPLIHAQEIPPTPLPSPTAPESPPQLPSAEPAPTPANTAPAVTPPAVTPAQPAPAPAVPVKPVSAAPKPKATDSLTLRFEASFPAVVDGKKTSLPYRETLIIPPERLVQLRAQGKVTASLDADLKALLSRVTGPARDARFEVQPDGQWAIVQHNSFTVDAAAARSTLAAALKDGQTTLIKLIPTGSVAPKRTLDYFVSRGITAFLAGGQTGYDGSSPARITNIHVGTQAFQDKLFEGDTFSFNRMLGPITTRAGFVTGLVIAGERTASGIGGGICQVSTTVFRALYGAGLPITERRNHSYQVYYYDPQGLDATIYQPSQDLRFANDTGGALWFQSDWDDAQKLLVVRVFGKARDFDVQVQEPRILSTTPSPPDKIITDATLKKGERKQVDWAAQGAVIEVDRLFVRNGKTFKQDTLKSSYRPWPNIFTVGR
ncbi:VanW family protein [Deinococcus rubellus]|uniref:VanW family protein n=1 Tax=Deinococcus rubellus TaxID=1889240 RepID=A0ABY5YKD5_9DEIO|nr:VanW family protein [Deinococcus rubellus]UWX64557.1 VanW family protein [Deinococcus rubellus]